MRYFLEMCLGNRIVLLVFIAIVAIAGVLSALALPIDAVPDITNPQVQVLTNQPSYGSSDMEERVTIPVELAMSGLPDLEEIRSLSRAGLSAVTVVFREGVDILRSRMMMVERLAGIRERVPASVSPELSPLSTGLGEVVQFEVRTSQPCGDAAENKRYCRSLMDLRTLLDWTISSELRLVSGVVEVNSFGGEAKTFEIVPALARMRSHGLTTADIVGALQSSNQVAGGGIFSQSSEQLLVRGEARLRTVEDIEKVLITTRPEGVPIRIADVASVRLAPLIRYGAVTRDGRGEAVTGIVMMLAGANGRQVSRAVRAKIEEMSDRLPKDISIDIFYDRGLLVTQTIKTVAKNLGEGAILVIAAIWILLGDLRVGLIVATVIPFAMLVALTLMKLAGVSGTLMSLGAVDFGVVVDGSIIVVENAMVYLSAAMRQASAPLQFSEAAKIVVKSTIDVRKAALFGEAILIVVYLPLLGFTGVEGKMFAPMVTTLLFVIFGAFLASVTFVPVLAAMVLRHGPHLRETIPLAFLRRTHRRALEWCIQRPGVALAVCSLLATGGIIAGATLGATFVPRLDEGALMVQVGRLPEVSLAQSVGDATRVEKVLAMLSGVNTTICKTGRPEIATDPMGIDRSDCLVILDTDELKKQHLSQDKLLQQIAATLAAKTPDLSFSFSQPIELRMAELIRGTRSQVAATIYGEELNTLEKLGDDVMQVLSKIPHITDLRLEKTLGLPTMEVAVDSHSAGRFGVGTSNILEVVEAFGGRRVGDIYEGERRFPMRVRLDVSDGFDATRDAVMVRSESGKLVPFSVLTSTHIIDGPVSINREGLRRRVVVEANVRDADLATSLSIAERAVKNAVALPEGYTLVWGGESKNLQRSTRGLAVALPLALFLVIVLLFIAFSDVRTVLLIVLTIPFALVGGILALWARGMPFSVSAAVGFVALFGLAVLNGVVLLTKIRSCHKEGVAAREAALLGATERLRAVTLTAAVATLGFVPMAFSTSAGAEVQKPLATVVIGGLLSVGSLTLLFLPTAYAWVCRSRAEKSRAEKGQAP